MYVMADDQTYSKEEKRSGFDSDIDVWLFFTCGLCLWLWIYVLYQFLDKVYIT